MKNRLNMIVLNKLNPESFHYTAYELEFTFDLGWSEATSWSIEGERLDKYDSYSPVRWR